MAPHNSTNSQRRWMRPRPKSTEHEAQRWRRPSRRHRGPRPQLAGPFVAAMIMTDRKWRRHAPARSSPATAAAEIRCDAAIFSFFGTCVYVRRKAAILLMVRGCVSASVIAELLWFSDGGSVEVLGIVRVTVEIDRHESVGENIFLC